MYKKAFTEPVDSMAADGAEYEEKVCSLLRKLGLKDYYISFPYIVYAVCKVIACPVLLTCVCKGLYGDIAAHFNTSFACVEKNIRTGRDVIWSNRTNPVCSAVLGECIKKPTNTELIMRLCEYVAGGESAEQVI